MPHLIVKLWPGQTEKQKKQLAERITKVVMDVLQYGDESVSVAIVEISAKDWAESVYKPDILNKPKQLYKKRDTACPNYLSRHFCNEETVMRGTVLYGPRDVRFEHREMPRIEQPSDAVIRMAAT